VDFQVSVSGDSSSLQAAGFSWSVEEANGGTVDSSGRYTAPLSSGTFHVVAASKADPSKHARATVTVESAVVVSVSPKTANVVAGASASFTASVTGTSPGDSTDVTWAVQEQGGGTINGSGNYVAPGTTGTFHVVATSVADPSRTDTATVVVGAAPVIAVNIVPSTASTTTGGSLTFTATVTGTTAGQSTAVTWSVQEGGGGTIDSSGHYRAPSSTGTFHVVATSVADPSKSATATVSVTATPVVAVSVSPGTATVRVGGTAAFTATVTGTTTGQSTAVTWSVQESGGGTVDSSGHYTAPGTPGTFHVVATSVADPSKKATATVTVIPNIAVSVNPPSASTTTGGTVAFTATVTGTTAGQSTAVAWSVQESGGGPVDSAGRYTAPGVPGTFHVVATSAADPSKQAIATVTVIPPIAVAINPPTASTTTGGTVTFTATVTGTTGGQSTAVTWSVQESGGGTVDSSGHYNAPASAGTYHVVATSVADPSKSATATVTVTQPAQISVAVSPATANVSTSGTFTFSATVSGLTGGQSAAVTWSVQEGAAGGTIDGSGHYTAPASAGTFHVVATSVADPSKSATATVTVTQPAQISVTVAPATATVSPGGTFTFTATVTGTTGAQSTAVTWSVQEGAGGGSVDASGHYTAPAAAGTYHVVATSVADTSKKATATISVATVSIIPANRRTTWSPGILADQPLGLALGSDGLPQRTTVCATVNPGGNIQAAINGCPANQVVQLGAGTFTISSTIQLKSNVVLRGAGSGTGGTTIVKSNGGTVIAIGTQRDRICAAGNGQGVALTADGAKETNTLTIGSAAANFAVGDLVLVDQIDVSPVVLGDCSYNNLKRNNGDGWRSLSQVDEVVAVNAGSGTLTLGSPLHWTFQAGGSTRAEVVRVTSAPTVKWAGIEHLHLQGGSRGSYLGQSAGGIDISNAAYCWVKDVQTDATNDGMHVRLGGTYRSVVRDSYFHHSATYGFGQDCYGIVLGCGVAETLVENNIVRYMNKPIMFQISGGGNVIGYNYADNSWADNTWQEVNIDSHCSFSHMELMEGNLAPHMGATSTHGNAGYFTFFRNYSSTHFADPSVADTNLARTGNITALELEAGAVGMNVVGNVLGAAGITQQYDHFSNGSPGAIYELGNGGGGQNDIAATSLFRTGNYDYFHNSTQWDGSTVVPIPSSLYLSGAPAWWPSGTAWPWVGPDLSPMVKTLPAKVRSDSM
jgi:hypothetical protein